MWFVFAARAADVTLGGTVETFWSHNFNDPENGVTNLRGFDNRSDTISLSNVALDVTGNVAPVTAKLVLQAGLTPNTYTLAEPSRPQTGGVGESDRVTWRNVQQAWVSWAAVDHVAVEAGLFLSPIGPEGMWIKDNWNFSRSDLFFGFPFYHTGARVAWQANEHVKLTGAVYNGWNSVVDNNDAKSLSAQALVTTGPVTTSVLYFGGNERSEGAAEGTPWRSDFDVWSQVTVSDRLSFLAHGNGGFESNQLGTASWLAGALYARVQPVDRFYVAARGDWFTETTPEGGSSVFWPANADGVGRIASGTLTFEVQPVDGLSLRLEGRHDDANTAMFFDDDVPTDPVSGADVPEATAQDTVTVGLVAWF